MIVGLYRPLLPPKFEKAMATEMAVMVVWGHNNADFCCVFFNLMFNDCDELNEKGISGVIPEIFFYLPIAPIPNSIDFISFLLKLSYPGLRATGCFSKPRNLCLFQ